MSEYQKIQTGQAIYPEYSALSDLFLNLARVSTLDALDKIRKVVTPDDLLPPSVVAPRSPRRKRASDADGALVEMKASSAELMRRKRTTDAKTPVVQENQASEAKEATELDGVAPRRRATDEWVRLTEGAEELLGMALTARLLVLGMEEAPARRTETRTTVHEILPGAVRSKMSGIVRGREGWRRNMLAAKPR